MSGFEITPDRETRLYLDVPEVVMGRPAWSHRRDAVHLGKGVPQGFPRNSNVFFIGGEAWILRPFTAELAQIVQTDQGSALGLADVNAATGIESYNTWRAPTDLTGIGTAGSVISAGVPAFVKRVAASASWESVLSADATALPSPPQDVDQIIPLDRVIAGKTTYPENTPWLLHFATPEGFTGTDAFLSFHFGGETDVLPLSARGGQFCLTLRGGGEAQLWEYHGPDDPRPRRQFAWSEPVRDIGVYGMISIIPYAWNRICFLSPANPGFNVDQGFSLGGLLTALASVSIAAGKPVAQNLYREDFATTGHTHLRAATGEGTVRMDIRRDNREPFQIIRQRYPESGTIVDAPFFIPFPLPAGTPIRLQFFDYLMPGTSCTGALYDAQTHAALVPNGDGTFQALAGNRTYYARFTLTAPADGSQTPVLQGYAVDVPSGFLTRPQAPTTGGVLQRVSITGPDLTPDHESASFLLRDPTNQLPLLRIRDSIRSTLTVVEPGTNNVISHLIEGLTLRSVAAKMGLPGSVYPSAEWRDYDGRLVGLWAKLQRQVSLDLKDYRSDPLLPSQPWKVTAVIADLLGKCGVPPDEIAVPDLPLRLWHSDELSFEDYVLLPGASPSTLIQKLAKDFLGAVLLRDPNAGPRGLWRIIPNPGPPYTNFLASFLLDQAPGSAGKLQTHPGTYAANTTFIEHGTFRTYLRPPECNYVAVSTVGQMLPNQSGARVQNTSFMFNPLSFNFPGLATADPTHPDFLGEFVPIFVNDPTLGTQQAVDFMCRRIYDFACHAQKWAEFRAPLWLGWDPLDSLQAFKRPLRIHDLVWVGGFPALVRSCTPDLSVESGGDFHQMADYEIMFLFNFAEPALLT